MEGSEEKRNFVKEGIAAKATGLVESSREGEEGTVWKRVWERVWKKKCKGDAMVAGGRGWVETARLM